MKIISQLKAANLFQNHRGTINLAIAHYESSRMWGVYLMREVHNISNAMFEPVQTISFICYNVITKKLSFFICL